MKEKDFNSTISAFRNEHEVIIKRVMFNEYETQQFGQFFLSYNPMNV